MSYENETPMSDRIYITEAPKPENLQGYPVIAELESVDIEAITPYLLEHVYPDGAIILKQGQPSEIFHILLDGQLDVCLEQEREVSVATLEPGHFVGEMSCLTGNAVSATVRAIGTVRTLSMPREGMLLLMDRSSSFRQHMLEAMIQRISESNERVMEEYSRSLAVIRQLESERQVTYGSLIGSSVFMQTLREQVTAHAHDHAPLCILGEKGVGKFHVAYAIHQQSSRRELPILSVDGASFRLDEWEMKVRATREGTIVLEHADLLPADVLHQIISTLPRTRLMMTAQHMPDIDIQQLQVIPLRERVEDIPELVDAWLTEAQVVDREHPISRDAMNMICNYPYLSGNVQELKRVVEDSLVVSGGKTIQTRHLRFGRYRQPGERPKIGLALGSGSSKGAAHAGVLKVMEQADIPVDIIAGTSVGAFIGALYAGGQPISAFERVLPTVRWGQLVSLTMPPAAFVSNHPMVKFVEKYIGPVDFDQLRIPFAAVASDALSGEAYILNKGKVSHAICASTAIPGVMKPVNYQGRLLIDGAVAHPVPVALARSMGADIVVAVDLSAPASDKKAPKNFIGSILNTIEIMSKKIVTEELQLADIVLNPKFETLQVSFKASAEYIAAGEQAARASLDDLRRKIEQLG